MTNQQQAALTPAQVQQLQADQAASLLDQILAQSKPAERFRTLNDGLTKRIETIRDLLPDQLKSQAERFVRRAMLTFSQKEDLQKCTVASFILCVLKGAEVGLAIDGKLAHAVPHNNSVKENGREVWKKEAVFMPDYKGLLAVARRTGTIKDAYARLVYANDDFAAWDEDGQCHLIHRFDVRKPRGELLGAYAVIRFPSGDWRFEYMDLAELNRIMMRSRSKDKQGRLVGPWKSDLSEMQKKTVIKRALKTYAEDPAIVRALEFDEPQMYVLDDAKSNGQQGLPSARVSLRDWSADPGMSPYQQDVSAVDDIQAPENEEAEPPPPDEAPEDLEKTDYCRRVNDEIGAAANDDDVKGILSELETRRPWIGEVAYTTLRQAALARQEVLPKPRRK